MIEYYTGRDASQLTDDQLAMKVAHLQRIRKMEHEETLSEQLNLLFSGQRT
jgi:hypothetical protein